MQIINRPKLICQSREVDKRNGYTAEKWEMLFPLKILNQKLCAKNL